jgi:hypothetical protein
MSVEGGAFRCFIHTDKKGKPFETSKIDDWNAHCTTAVEPPHREAGQDFCPGCGVLVAFDLPFHPLGPDGSKGIGPIVCDDCESKKGKDSKVIKVEAQKKK